MCGHHYVTSGENECLLATSKKSKKSRVSEIHSPYFFNFSTLVKSRENGFLPLVGEIDDLFLEKLKRIEILSTVVM